MADAEPREPHPAFAELTVQREGLERYQLDAISPDRAVVAETVEDVGRALRGASEHQLAVAPIGGRTMLDLGMPPRRYDFALDLSRLNQVVDYEPDDFTITVQAGMSLAALQQVLAENGQFLPLDHPQFERATVGGLCAVGRGGLRRNSFGGPRDWLIGMRMILADGTAIAGGGRVVKNVSGYDLPKLFTGSLGTLGVIVETTFKLRPQPASDQIVAISSPTLETALRAARAAAQAAPFLNACVVLSADAAARAQQLGADTLSDQPTLLLRANGLESAANEVLAQALAAAQDAGLDGPVKRAANIVETWQAIADLELQTPPTAMRLRIGLPPANLIRAHDLIANRLEQTAAVVTAADSGLIYLGVSSVDSQAIGELRQALGPLQARLTVESAPPDYKRSCNIWGPAGPGARLMHNIKRQFDPNSILNPGRFVDDI